MTEKESKLAKIRSYATAVVNKEQDDNQAIDFDKNIEELAKSISLSAELINTSSQENVEETVFAEQSLNKNNLDIKNKQAKIDKMRAYIMTNEYKNLNSAADEEFFPEINSQINLNEQDNTNTDVFNQTDITNIKVKKKKSFRFKLCMGVFVGLFVLLGGLLVSNAVKISNLSNDIASQTQTNADLDIDIRSLITQIGNLDSTDKDPSTSINPLEHFIKLTPPALDDVTQMEEKTNWFDAICNWISNWFS